MDDIVRQAISKWPNVPHCYAWLALDARGNWRMRDERCQALGLPGDRIRNATLLNFINRNYLHDADGRWYFQNGPQRVYVDLEIAPFVCRSDPQQGFILHTGQPMPMPRSAVLTREGDLVFALDTACAALDDRDLAACLPRLTLSGKTFDELALAAWSEDADPGPAAFDWNGQPIPLTRMDRAELPQRFGFNRQPRLG
jgi:hypothetical protein